MSATLVVGTLFLGAGIERFTAHVTSPQAEAPAK
jgi:hypothetical protein